jgi:hypothetical protein
VGALPVNNKYRYFITPLWPYWLRLQHTPKIDLPTGSITEREMHLIQGSSSSQCLRGESTGFQEEVHQ